LASCADLLRSQQTPATPVVEFSILLFFYFILSVGYEDEWLILGANLDAPDPWFVVRYHGSNAAWAGYGGLNVYTRSGLEPSAGIERKELERVLAIAGIRLDMLTRVDNSCGDK